METTIKAYAINVAYTKMTIVGDTPLLIHKYYDAGPNPTKEPNEIIKLCVHYHPDGGYAVPGNSIKLCMISACNTTAKGIMTKSKCKGSVFIVEYLAKIIGSDPVPYTRMVKTDKGVYISKTSARFENWQIPFTVRYIPSLVNPTQIYNLLAWAGITMGMGVHAPRSQSSGPFGTFHLGEAVEVSDNATSQSR